MVFSFFFPIVGAFKMPTEVAKCLLKNVCIIEGMMAEINAKLILIKPKIEIENEFGITDNLDTKLSIRKLEIDLMNLNNLLDTVERIYSRYKAA
jgi:hypothetical protein